MQRLRNDLYLIGFLLKTVTQFNDQPLLSRDFDIERIRATITSNNHMTCQGEMKIHHSFIFHHFYGYRYRPITDLRIFNNFKELCSNVVVELMRSRFQSMKRQRVSFRIVHRFLKKAAKL